MGMHNAANFRVTAIQRQVGWRVGRGFFNPLDHLARGNVHHHHILCRHYAIVDAGGLDDKHAALAIDGADVAPGEGDQIMFR